MSDLLQDIWHDLRERRLVPVVALLLVAILAIPVLLTKSAAGPSSPVQAPAQPNGARQASLQLDSADAASSATGSALDAFDPRNPFSPPKAVTKPRAATTGAEDSAAGASDEGAAGGGAPGSEQAPDDGGSAPGAPAPVAPPTRTAEFQYVADVTFWTGNRRRAIHGLRKLDMLPNEAAPVLIFMGVTRSGGNAVFLVDSTLRAAGEGRCVPTHSNCAFVHIGPGAEHTFSTEDGDSYRLRIDEIRRAKVGASASADPGARASVGEAGRRFALPSLTDLIVVSGPADAGSETASSVDGSSDRPASR
jgi:hypothetical protein